jgi:hypothetical protein
MNQMIFNIFIFYWMRNLRAKKIKTEVSLYQFGAFDDSLIQVELDRNEKCLQ